MEINKELLSAILASEIAGIAVGNLNKEMYDNLYNFLFNCYINLDQKTLSNIKNTISLNI